MQNGAPSITPLRLILCVAAPVFWNAGAAIPIGALERQGWDLTWVVVGSLVFSATLGFVLLTKSVSRIRALFVGLVYYPFVLTLSFYAGLIVVGRMYRSYL